MGTNYNLLPVWVMEPVRGGKLVNLKEDALDKVKKFRPEISPAQFAFRWLQDIPNVKVILSGMSGFDQMIDNIKTFEKSNPLSDEEKTFLAELAEGMKDSLPCTACRYCVEGCPKNLDIPKLIGLYNEMRFSSSFNIGMTMEAMSKDKQPSECISCGKCQKTCPQRIDIPNAMADFGKMLEKLPSWAEMSRQREEAAKKLREKNL